MVASPPQTLLVTSRDLELLAALDWSPHSARQLLKLSMTWPQAFRSLRTIRERLQQLGETGLVKTFRYATLFPGQPENYYLLSPAGFRTLHGPHAVPPTKGHFSKLALSRHAHTRALADFLVHTAVAAHHGGVQMSAIQRENSLRLSAAAESIYPDAGFVLSGRDGTPLQYYVEIDCGTERLQSPTSDRTWERKARIYDRVHDAKSGNRFRVLVVTVNAGSQRLKHMLSVAAAVQRHNEQTLFCGIPLFGYLASELAVTSSVFVDHRGRRQALIPPKNFSDAAVVTALQAVQ